MFTLDCLQLNYSAGSQTAVGWGISRELCIDKSCKMLWRSPDSTLNYMFGRHEVTIITPSDRHENISL